MEAYPPLYIPLPLTVARQASCLPHLLHCTAQFACAANRVLELSIST